jgi:hypothetical protein
MWAVVFTVSEVHAASIFRIDVSDTAHMHTVQKLENGIGIKSELSWKTKMSKI